MKKIIISMFLIMAAGILFSCGKSKEKMDSYLVYYLNQDMTGLVGRWNLLMKKRIRTQLLPIY